MLIETKGQIMVNKFTKCVNVLANKCASAFVDGRANMPVNSSFVSNFVQNCSLSLSLRG
jgi:hypothetical protein